MPVPGFSHFKRVTSDCRPFRSGGALGVCRRCASVVKRVDAAWEREVGEIYADYDIFHQSDGSEQLVYNSDDGRASYRSDPLVDRIQALLPLPTGGRLLDVGCGKGAFLSAWARSRPDWKLEGHEVGEQTREFVEAIPGVTRLNTGPLERIEGAFDLVSMVHVLEHISDPISALREIRERVAPGGWLFVEVPHFVERAFDLLVADHCSHLTPDSLTRVFANAGFESVSVSDGWNAKEVSGVFQPGSGEALGSEEAPSFPEAFFAVARALAWLEGTLSLADRVRTRRGFGVFGTSIAATWLASSVASPVDFFVDEDPHRQGRHHMGKPVIAPSEVPTDSTVFMCLPHPQAAHVSDRLTPPRQSWNTLLPPAPL